MFGHTTDKTEECMALTVFLALSLNKKIADLRRDGTFSWARPNTKTQVTIGYENDYQKIKMPSTIVEIISIQYEVLVNTIEAVMKKEKNETGMFDDDKND